MIFNENECSSKIVAPPLFSVRDRLFTNNKQFQLNKSSEYSTFIYSNNQSYKQNQSSIHIIIIITISLLIILVVLLISILIYINASGKRCSNIDLTTTKTRQTSSSNNLEINN
ncbi:unnamed protein product, partial [Rotaria sp. Silwood2]